MIRQHVAIATQCGACASPAIELFFEQRNVPVHSNRLFLTQAEALACPRGDVLLAFCHECGFITNVAYEDTGVLDIETSQDASPRFQQYARELAADWIDGYVLRGSTVLEIGAGQGQFLRSMLELGIGRGIAVDPALSSAVTDGGLERVPERFSAEHLDASVRAIVCRHTLEHLAQPGEFVRDVRAAIGAGDAVALFEVPDVLRILREAAFWDIYYEHVGYFSAGSLARVFDEAGFYLRDLRLRYGDQYLVIEAAPRAGRGYFGVPNDHALLRDAVEQFARAVTAARDELQALFADLTRAEQRVALWGAGSKATAYLVNLELGDAVECVVDVNPRKQGTYIAGTGHPVVSPQALQALRPDVVVVMNDVYRQEIGDMLAALGVGARVIGSAGQ